MNIQDKNVVVEKLLLVEEKGSQNDMYIRPYEVNMDMGQMEQLRDNIRVGLSRRGASTVVPMDNLNIINVGNQILGKAQIANGWQHSRFKFILVLSTTVTGNNDTVYYMQGYTNYMDTSLSFQNNPSLNFMAPDTVFHVNMVITMRRVRDYHSGIQSINVIGDSFIMHKDTVSDPYSINTNNELEVLTPSEAIMTSMQQRATDDNVFITGSSMGMEVPSASSKDEADPAQFMKSIVKNVTAANIEVGIFGTKEDIYDHALGEMGYGDKHGERAYSILSQLGNHTISNGAQLSDMLNSFHGLDDNTIFILHDDVTALNMNMPQNTLQQSDESESTMKTDFTTSVVLELSTAISMMMDKSMIAEVAFRLDNTSAGVPVCTILHSVPHVVGINLIPYLEMFKLHLENKLLKLSMNGQIGIDIAADCAAIDKHSINISVDGQPPVPYKIPVYANSKYVPIVTTAAHANQFNANVAELVNVVNDATTSILSESPQQQLYTEPNTGWMY